jgi:hypothetical protein
MNNVKTHLNLTLVNLRIKVGQPETQQNSKSQNSREADILIHKMLRQEDMIPPQHIKKINYV